MKENILYLKLVTGEDILAKCLKSKEGKDTVKINSPLQIHTTNMSMGAVFTAQVAYFVTAWGVAWSILILGEETSRYLWLSVAFMFFGMFLVLPKNNRVKTKSNVRVH